MNITDAALIDATREIILEGVRERHDASTEAFPDSDLWQRMQQIGSELWLDTGDIEAAGELWVRQFSALTTNNTLLNNEVQRGTYDRLVRQSAERLRARLGKIEEGPLIREIAFVLNARHALRLVEQFDAFVSVELHTDVAHDIDATYDYGRRYHEICPERFIIKVPLTPAGLVAAGRLSADGVPLNFTLGFSARQNLLISVLAQPQFCNVFLGRLNQVVTENHLGSGQWVGERAAAASQRLVSRLRDENQVPTRQIAASLRTGEQIQALAGVDVLTMPPKAAQGFLDLGLQPASLRRGIDEEFSPQWADGVDSHHYALETLWDTPPGLHELAEKIARQGIAKFDGPALQAELADGGFGDVLPAWTDADLRRASADGKIPKLAAWRDRLSAGEIGLDALMTLSGLLSFVADQKAMDERIAQELAG